MNRLSLASRALCLSLVVAAMTSSACTHTPDAPAVVISDDDALARLTRAGVGRERFEGVVKAAMPGLQGVVVNATLDVAAASPDKLNVAVRSFFEVPQQVLVASGDVVTLYDASTGAAQFLRGRASPQSLQRVLGVPLAPDDVVALVLGRAPVDVVKPGWPKARVHVIGTDAATQTYTVAIERAGRGAIHWTARVADDVVVAAAAFTGDGRRLLTVQAADHQAHAGLSFANTLRVQMAEGSGSDAEVVLRIVDGGAGFNGPALADEVFVLEPPPGMPVGSL